VSVANIVKPKKVRTAVATSPSAVQDADVVDQSCMIEVSDYQPQLNTGLEAGMTSHTQITKNKSSLSEMDSGILMDEVKDDSAVGQTVRRKMSSRGARSKQESSVTCVKLSQTDSDSSRHNAQASRVRFVAHCSHGNVETSQEDSSEYSAREPMMSDSRRVTSPYIVRDRAPEFDDSGIKELSDAKVQSGSLNKKMASLQDDSAVGQTVGRRTSSRGAKSKQESSVTRVKRSQTDSSSSRHNGQTSHVRFVAASCHGSDESSQEDSSEYSAREPIMSDSRRVTSPCIVRDQAPEFDDSGIIKELSDAKVQLGSLNKKMALLQDESAVGQTVGRKISSRGAKSKQESSVTRVKPSQTDSSSRKHYGQTSHVRFVAVSCHGSDESSQETFLEYSAREPMMSDSLRVTSPGMVRDRAPGFDDSAIKDLSDAKVQLESFNEKMVPPPSRKKCARKEADNQQRCTSSSLQRHTDSSGETGNNDGHGSDNNEDPIVTDSSDNDEPAFASNQMTPNYSHTDAGIIVIVDTYMNFVCIISHDVNFLDLLYYLLFLCQLFCETDSTSAYTHMPYTNLPSHYFHHF